MTLKCIIIDDERGAQQVLQEYIRQDGKIELCGTFNNAVDAFHFLKEIRVDLLLLDINMPQVSGFGLLDMIDYKPMVIFTTAYSDHALKAFDYNAVDYLHKPIRFERFLMAMDKARKWQTMQYAEWAPEYLEVKVDSVVRQLKTRDIHYMESLGNYLKFYTADSNMLVLMTMNEIEQKLPPSSFVRVHKSYIVNSRHIKQTNDNSVVVMDTEIPIGKTYKKYFLEFMKRVRTYG